MLVTWQLKPSMEQEAQMTCCSIAHLMLKLCSHPQSSSSYSAVDFLQMQLGHPARELFLCRTVDAIEGHVVHGQLVAQKRLLWYAGDPETGTLHDTGNSSLQLPQSLTGAKYTGAPYFPVISRVQVDFFNLTVTVEDYKKPHSGLSSSGV